MWRAFFLLFSPIFKNQKMGEMQVGVVCGVNYNIFKDS